MVVASGAKPLFVAAREARLKPCPHEDGRADAFRGSEREEKEWLARVGMTGFVG